jgi:hypothetical protein
MEEPGLDVCDLVWFNEVSLICSLAVSRATFEFACFMQDRMSYRAKRSDGALVEVNQDEVYSHMIKYKTVALFNRDLVVLNDGERFASASGEDVRLVKGFLCPDLNSKPSVGKICIVLRHFSLDALFLALDPEEFHATFPVNEDAPHVSRIDAVE